MRFSCIILRAETLPLNPAHKHTCPPSEMPYRQYGIIIQDKKK